MSNAEANEKYFREEVQQATIVVKDAEGRELPVKEVRWEEDAEGLFLIEVTVK